MKNKNGKGFVEFFMTWGWVFLLFIIIIGSLIVIFSSKPEFTIYEEVCWGDSNCSWSSIVNNQLIEFKGDIDIIDVCSKLEGKVKNNSFGDVWFTDDFIKELCVKTKECEKVEVDELEIGVVIICEHYDWKIGECEESCGEKGCSFKIWQEEEMEQCIDEIYQCREKCKQDLCLGYKEIHKKISKKELTTEWLDENCECVECYVTEGVETRFPGDYSGDGGETWECLEYCTEYKCSDKYYVEVE
jgi:hypothetical protein